MNSLKISKIFLFIAALTPLIYSNSVIFPYLTAKLVFFRITLGFALVFFIAHKIFVIKTIGELKKYLKDIFRTYSRNPIILAIAVFFISLIISAVFAENSYQAFWGNLDRGDGLLSLLHYLVFALLLAAVFNNQDWKKFLTGFLVVGLIVIFYGFLQRFGVLKDFPFMPLGADVSRPGSFIGNSAFLAAYLILLITVSGLANISNDKKYKIFSYLTAILGVILVFLTRTRGAFVGIFTGLLVLFVYGIFSANKKIRKPVIILFFVFLAFCVFFASTYKNQFWQEIPGFDRISKTFSSVKTDASIQTRLIAWKASLEAFKEKPIFGWGLEDYLTAYSKHYDPKYAVFGETWLDRAHNKFIDVLVAQGLFGLVSYLGVLGVIFWSFRKHPFVLAGLSAYVIQNIFVFDDINSYALFYSILGFAIVYSTAERENSEPESELIVKFNLREIEAPKLAAAVLMLAAFLLSAYHYNYIPYQQAKYANLVFNTQPTPQNQETVAQYLEKSFYPYNFAQSSIRSLLFDRFYNIIDGFNVFENSQLNLVSKNIETAIDDQINKFPNYDPRFYLRKYQILFVMAKLPGNDALFEKAEPFARKGIKMAPRRQEFYYALAFTLAGQNRLQESIDAARYAVELEPLSPRAHYHLGVMYAIAQKKQEALKEFETLSSLNPDFSGIYYYDSSGLILTYKILGSFDKIAELAVLRSEGKIMINISKEDFLTSLKYFSEKRDKEYFIKIARHLSQTPDLKDDMEIFIDLAEKGLWDVIDNL